MPGLIAADDPTRQGWIEFGRPADEINCARLPELRTIRPEQGLLILFPSYYYHRTIPMRAHDTRISVAFDVEPV